MQALTYEQTLSFRETVPVGFDRSRFRLIVAGPV